MALANRRAVIEPASRRFRRTATVSTSTKSGAATSSALRNSDRARSPSSPSSLMTLARTDASMTINGVTVHQRCLRPPALGLLAHPCAARFQQRVLLWSVGPPGVRALRQDTAATTFPAARPAAGASRESHRGRHVPEGLPCFHYDSIGHQTTRPRKSTGSFGKGWQDRRDSGR
jgi:hypothetical protein